MLKAWLEAPSRAEPSWGSRRPCEAVNDGLDGPRVGLHFFKALGRRLVRRLGWLVELYSYFFFIHYLLHVLGFQQKILKKVWPATFLRVKGIGHVTIVIYAGGMFFFFFKTHCLLLINVFIGYHHTTW